jgi:hypothetical protein
VEYRPWPSVIADLNSGLSANLVNGAGVAKRSDVDRQLAFERQVNMESFTVPHSPRPARDRRQLPVERLAGASQRPQRLAPDLRVLLEYDLHSARLEYLHRAALDVVVIGALGGRQ